MIQSITQIKHDCVYECKDIDTHVIVLADTIVSMKTYGDRVRERREELGLTQAGLAKAIGAKHASTIGNIENRSGESRFTLELSKVLRVNPEWLKTGEGQREAIDLGLPISTPMRPVVLLDTEDEAGDAVIAVPRYTLKASAGHGTPILEVDTKGDPNYCRSAWAKRHGYKKESLFSIVASGDSMEPTIPNGASLIVHKQQEIANGKVHVICRGNECYVKRLYRQMDGSVTIHSDNEKLYREISAKPDDPDTLHVVGLVVSVSFNL